MGVAFYYAMKGGGDSCVSISQIRERLDDLSSRLVNVKGLNE